MGVAEDEEEEEVHMGYEMMDVIGMERKQTIVARLVATAKAKEDQEEEIYAFDG